MATKAQSVRSLEQRKNAEKKRLEERDSVKLKAAARTSEVLPKAPKAVRPSPRGRVA